MNIERSPLGHEHNQIITCTNSERGYSATFQWDGVNGVYVLITRKEVTNMHKEVIGPGGVMGFVANCRDLPTKVAYNYDIEAKKSSTKEVVGEDVVELVEEAVVNGNQAVIDRIVNRSRWDMDNMVQD